MYLEVEIKIEDVMTELEKMTYDNNNIFAKILRGEICKKFMRTIIFYHFMI